MSRVEYTDKVPYALVIQRLDKSNISSLSLRNGNGKSLHNMFTSPNTSSLNIIVQNHSKWDGKWWIIEFCGLKGICEVNKRFTRNKSEYRIF